ncbi:MAG: DUF456 domain-containing protein [Bacteroidota bacterium]|jgi:uncharacterized protein YqgC (DUF456 family)
MSFDILLLVLSFLLIVAGIAGSFLPALPGPPLAYAGIWAAQYSSYAPFGTTTLVVYGIGVVIISVVDYLLPMWATRISGGTPQGARGAMIGTVVGMFVPIPFALFLGAFIGAVMGELSAGKSQREAVIAGAAAFIGFVAGSLMKLFFCVWLGLHLLVSLIF